MVYLLTEMTDRQTNIKADRQSGRQKGRQKDRQADRQTEEWRRQTDRQTDTKGRTAKQTEESDKTDRTEKQAADKTGRQTDRKSFFNKLEPRKTRQEHCSIIFHGKNPCTGIGRKSMRSGWTWRKIREKSTIRPVAYTLQYMTLPIQNLFSFFVFVSFSRTAKDRFEMEGCGYAVWARLRKKGETIKSSICPLYNLYI
jgi:hypothetical protein